MKKQKKHSQIQEINDESTSKSFETLSSDQVGYSILKRLGWDDKHALGKDDTAPRNEPLVVMKRTDRAGLGFP